MNAGTINGGRILIVEPNGPQGEMYADLIATHCATIRIDVCRDADCPTLGDNAGGADLAICSCGPTPGTRFDDLRRLLTARPCLSVLVLIPADQPRLADEAIAAGATDVLLRAPGYLQQLPICIRKNIATSRAAIRRRTRTDELCRELRVATTRISALENELATATVVVTPRSTGRLPLPIITRQRVHAMAA